MGLAASTPAGAQGSLKPRSDEWWFGSWAVQDKLWPQSQGKGVIVAVLDTGVQADIPELSGVVLPGTDITGGGDGRTDKDDAPVPGHGTGMATLIAAQGGPNHFVGVAPQARILPVTAHTDAAAIAPGIRYAVDHGADVINISQVVPVRCQDDVQQAVGYALEHNVVVVAGAGNEGDEANASYSPANCAGVLAVGAVGFSGPSFVAWPKTERQPYVVVGAPGVDVGGVLRDGQYHTASGGTSAATALTSAAAALVRSKYPDMPAREVVRRLIDSSLDVDPPGKDDRTGYGIIRPNRALTGQGLSNAPNTVFAAYDKWKAAQASASPSDAAQASGSSSGGSDSPVPLLPAAAAAIVVLAAALAAVFRRRRRS